MDEIPFGLLELADPSRTRIKSYLKKDTCHIARLHSKIVGVVVLKKIDSSTVEIKNIAIKESEQGKGYGKSLLKYADQITRKLGCEKIIVGTGNSSIEQLALYQKEGFELKNIIKDFFLENYPDPIFENKIQCKNMIILEKDLTV
ncbi:MAG: GNAT family N-acetyltransferase [Muricauda sp.]|nr:GNAT family N-acetyltransferase [Allomuricauda sp.]|tara:strand:- start:374 stop:808 length:435 start_codon:yes stop_codon:yes gene_type:complete